MMARVEPTPTEPIVVYKVLFRLLPIPAALVGGDLVVHDATDAFADAVGGDLPSLIGAPLSIVFPSGEAVDGARAAAAGGPKFACDAASVAGMPLRLVVEPVDEDERLGLAVLSIGADPGETVDGLRASIRAIKHEINNPLTGALGNINLLLRRTDLDEKTRRRLATAEQEIKKVSQLVVRLSELAPSPGARSE